MKNKENRKKPKYGIPATVCYMVGKARRRAPSVLVLLVTLLALSMTMSLLQLFVVPVILDEIENQVALGGLVKTIVLFTLGLVSVGALTAYIDENKIWGRIEIRSSIVNDIHNKICTTSYCNLAKQSFLNQSEKAVATTQGNWEATEAVWESLYELSLNVLGFIVYLLLMTRLNPGILLLTAVTAVLSYRMAARVEHWRYGKKEQLMRMKRKLKYIRGKSSDRQFAKDVRIFRMGECLTEMGKRELAKIYAMFREEQRRCLGADLVDVLMALLRNGIAYLYLIGLVLENNLSVAEFLLYFSAVTGFTQWVTGILKATGKLKQQSAEISCVMEFLEYQEEYRFEDGKPLSHTSGQTYELELRDVSFRYPGADSDVLSHVNLKIGKGEKLAVVGRNGAGKTTLVKLLCGFYDPTEGEVLLNGQDIRQYNRRDYYRLFSAVFQDFSLLAGTIVMNVAQSADEIDMERVKDCVERVGLKEKIESMPDGYDTHLEKEVYLDAVSLSGGETQRLMLARALYKDAPVIVLDEPTAALDPLAESDMYNRYHELTRDATSVYVSHRLASTRFCDRIILIGDGGISEVGTHEQLLAAGGEYAHLFEVQSQYYREGGIENGEQ